LEEEKKRTVKGIEKATELVKETRAALDIMEAKLRDVEEPNEKKHVDYRSLVKYREDLTALLDDVSRRKASDLLS
jgi:hypothetical protein